MLSAVRATLWSMDIPRVRQIENISGDWKDIVKVYAILLKFTDIEICFQ